MPLIPLLLIQLVEVQSWQRVLEGRSVREGLGRHLGPVAAEVLRDDLEAAGEGAGKVRIRAVGLIWHEVMISPDIIALIDLWSRSLNINLCNLT